MKTTSILIAGFGGQGTLFAGKVLAYASLYKGLEVSWLPSYGPEMRGGTANCGVIISDTPIGSPIVSKPDILIALNKPSFEKYEKAVVPGGLILVDSSLVDSTSSRDDIKVCYVKASETAAGLGTPGLANIVLIGRLLKESGLFTAEEIGEVFDKLIPERKAAMRAQNRAAIAEGSK